MSAERWSLPSTWCWVTIGEIADIVGGGTPSSKDETNFAIEGIPWLTPADLTGYLETYIERGARDLSEKGYRTSSAKLMPAGTVLFSSRAPIGYCVIAVNEISTNQGFKNFILPAELVPEYVRYYLISAKDYAESIASGTTFKELSGSRAATMLIPLPPLPEQRRIVAKLDALMARTRQAREALQHIPTLIEHYKQAILAAAFRGELTADWREETEYEPASVLLERILEERRARWEYEQLAAYEAKGRKPPKNWQAKYQEPEIPDTSNLPDLPEGWVWASAEQICDFITKGTTPKAGEMTASTGEIPFLKVYNLTHTGSLDFTVNPTFVSKETHEGFLARSKILPEDVLMNIVGPPLGKVAIVPDTYPEWNMNQAIVRYRTLPSMNNKYLSICLMSDSILSWATTQAKATAGQFNLTLAICRELPIPIPPINEQVRIVQLIQDAVQWLDIVLEEATSALQLLDHLDQATLAKAFRGELVPQDPNDEPASVLLERIRAARAAESNASKRKQRGKK